jgi:hypothetical protein
MRNAELVFKEFIPPKIQMPFWQEPRSRTQVDDTLGLGMGKIRKVPPTVSLIRCIQRIR